MEFETVLLDINDGIAKLSLNRPHVLNAINMDLIRDIRAAIKEVNENQAVRALVLTGEGRGFCSGADLAAPATPADGDERNLSVGERTAERMDNAFNPMIQEIYECRVPIVAAINGVAAGGGMGVALLGDIVIAARSAKFIQVFTPKLGLIPDLGCTWHLQRLVGRSRALGLALLGDRIPAEQAQEWGLIWKCVDDDDLMPEAMKLAETLRDGPAQAYTEVRRALAQAEHNTLPQQLKYERDIQKGLADTEDFMEGVLSFMQKRKPAFKGK